jgi:hypothetical protein
MNWQEVQVNLMSVKPEVITNIHITVENNKVAVLFKIGDCQARRDNKVLAENAEESYILLDWMTVTFEHVATTFEHVIALYAKENIFNVVDENSVDVTVCGILFTIRPSVHPFTKTTLYQIRRNGVFMGSHSDFIVAKAILVNGFKRANMPIPSVLK